MREIKFRAWDKKNNRLFQVHSFDTIDSGCCPRRIEGEGIDCLEFVKVEDCILTQYTGLKDKNGKEIYEGDIVQSPYGRRETVEYYDYLAGYYPFSSPADGGYEWENEDAKYIEVVGNIYENPELRNG